VNDENFIVNSANVKDKFGDSGITGVFIIKKTTNEWILDTFLLSCNVMGRNIENTIISFILSDAKKQKISMVKGKFIPTEKNQPASSFYLDSGFRKEKYFWVFRLGDKIKTPKYISINNKDNV
jgi:FkbH-like protein